MAKNITKEKKNIGIIIVFAVILSIVTIMNTLLVFRMTLKQTMDEGEFQIASISGELEVSIGNAKSQTMEIALLAKDYLDDKQALGEFISDYKRILTEKTNGQCYNLYIAGTGWDIIPDLVKPEGFIATERSWYKGAISNHGAVYVTAPYVDAWTGNICYSMAIEMGDGDTVLGMDYTIDNIQKYITQISQSGEQDAIIVTDDGIIAGYSQEEKIGDNIINVFPELSGILAKAKQSEGVVTSKLNVGLTSDYLFASHSSSGLYLIVSENAWQLYKNSYLQFGVTIALSVALFVIIISLYLSSKRNQEKAEKALASKDDFLKHIANELRSPLKSIINTTSYEGLIHSDNFEQEIDKIHNAGTELSNMLEQIVSYSTIVQTEKDEATKSAGFDRKISMRFRNTIIGILSVVMVFSCYLNISNTYKLANANMKAQVQDYQDHLSEWINTQKSILDMFCSLISTNPEMLDDYEYTINYLNDITLQYPEISVTYMTNPEFEHTVLMNNGWEPDEDWHVEERQWYIDTMNSPEGWSISAPYYDEQTGIYCITLSESVYDDVTGEFLGNFGIDFYMDKLIDILGASYSDKGYAFLVDADGEIINHPYGAYQMSVDKVTNISDLSYLENGTNDEKMTRFIDYDGTHKLVISSKDDLSGFSVFVVSSIWEIYGKVVIYSLICICLFVFCIVVVYRIISNLLKWQEDVNNNLKEAADAAIAAGNAKSQFLAQMSHEIRTPINAVLGMNEMILRESNSNEILEYAGNIQSAGNTLLSLINTILDFSKIEDGKMEIIPVNYDVASMINDLVHTISDRAISKSLELKVIVDEHIPAKLFGDDVRVRQVITNLLTNAVKYTEKGSVTFSVKEHSRLEDEIVLEIAVQDTGIGIREEDREKLFESFQRLEEKRNRNIEGTGLGISIVTKLLNMMNSKLIVESVYGEGSTFSFLLTQKIVNDEPIGDYVKRLEMSTKKESSEKYLYAPSAKILVTDDNEMNIKVVKNLMKRNGFVPDVAYSGYEAIELVRNNEYDIIFLDHMMPKLDGIETLHIMQEDNLLPSNTKVIALTANAIVGAKEEYLAAGFDDYLSKPVKVLDMERKLAQYLPADRISYKSTNDNTEVMNEKSSIKSRNVIDVSDINTNRTSDIISDMTTNKALVDNKVIDTESANKNNVDTEVIDSNITDSWQTRWNRICPEIDIASGLSYCINDEEFYLSVVMEYVNESKIEELNKFYKEESIADYQVLVHALKSTSLTIGLNDLSAKAKALETAAKEKNIEYIRDNHDKVMEEYKAILSKLNQCLEEK